MFNFCNAKTGLFADDLATADIDLAPSVTRSLSDMILTIYDIYFIMPF